MVHRETVSTETSDLSRLPKRHVRSSLAEFSTLGHATHLLRQPGGKVHALANSFQGNLQTSLCTKLLHKRSDPIHTAGWAKSRRRTNHVILSLWHACDYLFGSGRGFPSARCHGRSLLLSLLAANTEKRTEKRLTARHLGRQWSARSVRVIRRRSRGQPALSLRNGPR